MTYYTSDEEDAANAAASMYDWALKYQARKTNISFTKNATRLLKKYNIL